MTKETRIYNGEKAVSSISGAGENGQLLVKDWISTVYSTIHKNKLKMEQRPKCNTGYYKTPRGKHRQTVFDINHTIFFGGSIP